MWDESGEAWAGLGMRDGMSLDKTARVVPPSNMMRYWGDNVESKGISITVLARLQPDGRVVSRTLVPGGYGSLMTGVSSRWSDMKRTLSYLIVGYTEEGRL